ncbi:MAG TPA: tetratricopeptide repeat protein [Pirellulaceae bacterium]|nr:tetratricopeptide repeat protein [Pirellulaceae bacterium]
MRDSMSRALILTWVLPSVLGWCGAVARAQQSDTNESSQRTAVATEEAEAAPNSAEIQTAGFLGVTPGETTLAEVIEKLGDPRNELGNDIDAVLEYQVGPFPKVEVFLTNDVVVSVLAQLDVPREPSALAKELGLTAFTPVVVKNAEEALGIAYPERGVLFSYAANSPRPRVSQLLLEAPSAEMFLLRVAATPSDQYTQKLADLERVLDIDPRNAEAHWLGAQLLAITGKPEEALKLAKKATLLAPKNDRYQLTQAKFTARAGDQQGSVVAVKRLLDRTDVAAVDRARAELDLGDLMSSGLNRDYQAAVKHHLAAVKTVTPLVTDEDVHIRHEAEQILVDAHLGAASDIAQGHWARKSEVVPKWLHSAEELATGFVQNDGADPILPILVWRRTLEVYAAMDGEVIDTSSVVEAAQEMGNQLIEASTDPLYKQHIQWELLQANYAALRIEQSRARYSQALKYAGEAVRLVDELPKDRKANSQARYLIGRLYFYVGSIYAINHKEHSEAVRWYERALPHFDDGLPKSDLYDTGIHGERLVSMGVSYWKAEAADEAVKLTERGLDLMERATKASLLDQQSLIVPYANLAEMHRAGGHSAKAQDYAAKVARLQDDKTQR